VAEIVSKILKVFADNGLFDEGVELIGSWCFRLYQKHLGVTNFPWHLPEGGALFCVGMGTAHPEANRFQGGREETVIRFLENRTVPIIPASPVFPEFLIT